MAKPRETRAEIELRTTDIRVTLKLKVDVEALRLELEGHDAAFAETYPTRAALQAAYRERVEPVLGTYQARTVYDGKRIKKGTTLAELVAEYGWTASIRPVVVPEDTRTLDDQVAEATAIIRDCLDTALGGRARTVNDAILFIGASMVNVMGFHVNAKGLRDVTDDAEAEAVMGGERGPWFANEIHAPVRLSIEETSIGGAAFAPYGSPTNFYEPWFAPLIHMACARIEAAPGLRRNVTVGPHFRLCFLWNEDKVVDLPLHRLARAHLGKPAKPYFDAATVTTR